MRLMVLMSKFPQTNRLMMVKWTDGLKMPFLRSDSSGISVQLDEVPADSIATVNRMTQRTIRSWLRSPKKGDVASQQAAAARECGVHAWAQIGDLPLLAIGDIYQQQRRVGTVPMETATITMTHNDVDLNLRLGEKIKAPPGWIGDFYPLNHFEYELVEEPFSTSRYLAIRDHRLRTDYIIPRTEIFRRFYGPHSELARTFTYDRWDLVYDQVIYEGEMESGLKTERYHDRYHIIVQTLVPSPYARLLAMFLFDDYARTCAQAIFGSAVIDSGGDFLRTSPCLAARIPYRASPEDPLIMRARGWHLGNPDRDRAIGGYAKFLVARLNSCTEPRYVPDIWYERFNSGKGGKETSREVERSSFPHGTAPHEASSELPLAAGIDANKEASDALIEADEFFFTNAKPLRELPKESSKRYTGRGAPPLDDSIPDLASSGVRRHGEDLPAPARIQTPVRDQIPRFGLLRESFTELVHLGVLHEFAVEVAPPWQLISCGEEDCWHFLQQHQARQPCWPRCGWEMIDRAVGHGRRYQPGRPRSAFILRLIGPEAVAFWIEIESKGTNGFKSLLLVGINGDLHETLSNTLRAIVKVGGRNFDQELSPLLGNQVDRIHAIQHHYQPGSNVAVTAKSLIDALTEAKVTTPQGPGRLPPVF